MVIRNVTVNNCIPETIVLGRRGTYNTQEVTFDLSYLVDNYGAGTAALMVKRSQDTSAYPAIVSQEDNTLTWVVSDVDTYYPGAGECELMWYVDEGLAKTIIYPLVVMRDILQTTEEPPDGYENWVEHLTGLGVETEQNAQEAAQSATEAKNAKDDAVTAKEKAEEAAGKAEAVVTHAPIIQDGYWYIWNDGQYVDTGVHAEGQKGDKGDTGEKGDAGNGIASITKTGTSGLVDTYTVTYTDGTSTTFTVTNGAKGDKGDTGATGNGIQSITKTGTSGNVDTYTITYTNGQTTTFTVTNGAVTSVAGKTGAVVLDSGDIAYDETATYQSGTAGAALNDLSRQISDETTGLGTKAPVILETASGAIASFSDGADGMPIRKLVAQIEPVQDLHGYANPWPAGGGKNIFNPQLILDAGGTYNNGQYNATQTILSSVDFSGITFDENTVYYFYVLGKVNSSNTGGAMRVKITYTDDTASYVSLIFADAEAAHSGESTTGKSIARIEFSAYGTAGSDTNYIKQIMICKASAGTAYAPYENLCPISGWTGAEIEGTGKNLFDETKYQNLVTNYDYNSDGYLCKIIHLKPNTAYTISQRAGTASSVILIVNNTRKVNGVGYLDTRSPASNKTFTTDESGNLYIGVAYSTDTTYNERLALCKIQIELGSTATDYEPYQGNQISVTFPDEAGTVYGGTITINPDRTGTLVVDRRFIDLSTITPSNVQYDGKTINYSDLGFGPKGYSLADNDLKCNRFNPVNYSAAFDNSIFFVNLAIIRIMSSISIGTTPQEVKAYFVENPCHIVYRISNPVTYTLTAEQVSGILETIYGTNNIWANTGDIEVEYPCDTRLFIEGKIAEAVANAMNS